MLNTIFLGKCSFWRSRIRPVTQDAEPAIVQSDSGLTGDHLFVSNVHQSHHRSVTALEDSGDKARMRFVKSGRHRSILPMRSLSVPEHRVNKLSAHHQRMGFAQAFPPPVELDSPPFAKTLAVLSQSDPKLNPVKFLQSPPLLRLYLWYFANTAQSRRSQMFVPVAVIAFPDGETRLVS